LGNTLQVGEGLVCAEGEVGEMKVAYGCVVAAECGGIAAEVLSCR